MSTKNRETKSPSDDPNHPDYIGAFPGGKPKPAGRRIVEKVIVLALVIWGIARAWQSGESQAPPSATTRPSSLRAQHSQTKSQDAVGPVMVLVVKKPQNWSRAGAIVGTHKVRLERRVVDGTDFVVGCVPCFNAMTTFVVQGGTAYALNGTSMSWRKNYSGTVDSRPVTFRDITDSRDLYPRAMSLLGAAQGVPGCEPGGRSGSLDRSVRAVMDGECLGR